MHCIKNLFSIIFVLVPNFLPFGAFKECPERNGYFTNADGGRCWKRDELGYALRKTPDDCQKMCDANPKCISFEHSDNECYLSSSCTYDLATKEKNVLEKYGLCLYVKQGHKILFYQKIYF